MQVKNNYNILKKIQLSIWFIRTKLICRKARFIRFPIDIRGKKYINFGEQLTTGIGCRLEAFSSDGSKTLFFGKNVQINDYVHISSMKNVSIGNNVLMASKIYISDNSHGFYKGNEYDSSPEIAPINRPYFISEVIIKDNVWIGEGVTILPGVTIHTGTIIGANSTVSKSLPPFVIAIGAPAKPIKQFCFDTQKWEKI